MDTIRGRLLLLRETASLLRSRMSAGLPAEALLEQISNRYGVEAKTKAHDFVARLTESGGLRPRTLQDWTCTKIRRLRRWANTFRSSVVVYDDLTDIITMDPIHSVVVDSGWPRVAAESRE